MEKEFNYEEFINNLSKEEAAKFLDALSKALRTGDGDEPAGLIRKEK